MVRAGCCLALGSLVLAACATQSRSTKAANLGAGPLYDSAAEWLADRAAEPTPPARPRWRARPRRDDSWAAAQRELDLDALPSRQRARIAELQPIVLVAARSHGLPADLVNGIIWVESKFQPAARSRTGSCGLMQLMPTTGREVARALGRSYRPYDPEFNIHAGTYYFARMLERFDGDLTLALAAYNTGPGAVERFLRDNRGLPDYSRAYVDNVFSAARAFRRVSPP